MTEENTSVRTRLLAWERLRILYNLIMLFIGIFVALSVYHNVNAIDPELRQGFLFSYSPACIIGLSFVFGVAANVMYTLGPAFEIYVVSFTGFRFRSFSRIILFAIGLVISLGIQVILWLHFALLEFALMDW